MKIKHNFKVSTRFSLVLGQLPPGKLSPTLKLIPTLTQTLTLIGGGRDWVRGAIFLGGNCLDTVLISCYIRRHGEKGCEESEKNPNSVLMNLQVV